MTLKFNSIALFALLSIAVPMGSQAQQPPASARTGANAAKSATTGTSASLRVMQLKKGITGDLSYRFVGLTDKPGGAASTPPLPLPASSGSDNVVAISIPSETKIEESQLEVLDNGRGNLARLPIDLKTVSNLSETSFNTAQRISVPVQSKGLGVIGAQVTMTNASKKFSQSRLLQADDNGVARFDGVPLNEPVTVSVSFGAHSPESVTKTLTPIRPEVAWTPISVDWADAKTVLAPAISKTNGAEIGAGAGRNSSSEAPAKPVESQNPLNGLVSSVLSLFFIAAVGYGVFWAYKTGRLKTFLDKLGINTAEPAPAGGALPSPFKGSSAPPIAPISEGSVDPFGGGGVIGGVVAAPAMGPRLVASAGTYAGSIFPLTPGSVDIGRDPMNGVPLPNDTNSSRKHATIAGGNGQFTLTDNSSANGTYLNGVRIAAMTPQNLRQGDEVQIGMTRFRFEA